MRTITVNELAATLQELAKEYGDIPITSVAADSKGYIVVYKDSGIGMPIPIFRIKYLYID